MPGHESEAQTRKRRIDPRLQSAGWTIVPFRDGMDVASLTEHAIEEYPTETGPADYPIHALDLIIVANASAPAALKWREVLDHFDAIKIGLTANSNSSSRCRASHSSVGNRNTISPTRALLICRRTLGANSRGLQLLHGALIRPTGAFGNASRQALRRPTTQRMILDRR